MRLRQLTSLEPEAILALSDTALTDALRPVGYYNVKAQRLQALCHWLVQTGGLQALMRQSSEILRQGLLSVHGVGPETADDILLYACERPVFVIDAYTRRLFGRLGYIAGDEPYEQLRAGLEAALMPDVVVFKEYHALIVEHAKTVCRTKPTCICCILRNECAFAATHA